MGTNEVTRLKIMRIELNKKQSNPAVVAWFVKSSKFCTFCERWIQSHLRHVYMVKILNKKDLYTCYWTVEVPTSH